MSARLTKLVRVLCFIVTASLLCLQSFVPPIVGLSDNGDFHREIGVFGYGPEQRIPDPSQVYVAPTYIPRPDFRAPDYEHWTSNYLFVLPALAAGKIIPITLIGAIHVLALLAAVARLFWVTQNPLVWIGAAFILTDIGYAAYANSFFGEAGSGIFAIWMIAEAIARRRVLFTIAVVLLICAKPQHAFLALPLAVFLLPDKLLASVILIAGELMFLTVKPGPKLETSYNMLFSAVLPESRDPRGDLKALNLDPELVRFKGTLAWSPNSALYEERVRKAMEPFGPIRIAAFYAARPTRLWRHITTLFPLATQLRPEACGNFELSAGKPPGARATHFSAWSQFHEKVLGRVTKYLLFGLLAMLVTGVVRRKPVIALLPALALTAFLTAAFGDANEPIKHQYLFNLMLDTCLLYALAALTSFSRKVCRPITELAYLALQSC